MQLCIFHLSCLSQGERSLLTLQDGKVVNGDVGEVRAPYYGGMAEPSDLACPPHKDCSSLIVTTFARSNENALFKHQSYRLPRGHKAGMHHDCHLVRSHGQNCMLPGLICILPLAQPLESCKSCRAVREMWVGNCDRAEASSPDMTRQFPPSSNTT
jgi:hypothetical protein